MRSECYAQWRADGDRDWDEAAFIRKVADALNAAEQMEDLQAALRSAGRALASIPENALGVILGTDPETQQSVSYGFVRDHLVDEIVRLVGPLKASADGVPFAPTAPASQKLKPLAWISAEGWTKVANAPFGQYEVKKGVDGTWVVYDFGNRHF